MQELRKKQRWFIVALGSLAVTALLSIGLFTGALKPDAFSEQSEVAAAEHIRTVATEDSVQWLTDEEWQTFEKATDKFREIQTLYTDNNGYVKPDKLGDVLEAIGQYAKKLTQAGVLEKYRVSHEYCNVYMDFSSGIPCLYRPPLEGMLSGPGPEESMSITSLYRITYSGEDAKYAEDWKKNYQPIKELEEIDKQFDNYTYTDKLYDGEITLETIKKAFGPNRIVYWTGHGSYDPEYGGACLSTEIFLTQQNAEYYKEDIAAGRIMVDATTNEIFVTSRFFEAYCGNMENSLIMFTSCHVMKDEKFYQAFLNKGAAAVLGYDSVTRQDYADNINASVLLMMRDYNIGTENYYTISEALELAKEVYGASATTPYEGVDYVSKPILKGDPNFRLMEMDPRQNSDLYGTVYATKAETEVVEGAKVVILDRMSRKLAETTTDEEGFFYFDDLRRIIKTGASIKIKAIDGGTVKMKSVRYQPGTSLVFYMREITGSVTPSPQKTVMPKETPGLQMTATPTITPAPQVTAIPTTTLTPQATTAPTTTPKVTPRPQATIMPTETPATTSSPQVTKTPAVTPSPKATTTPKPIWSPQVVVSSIPTFTPTPN